MGCCPVPKFQDPNMVSMTMYVDKVPVAATAVVQMTTYPSFTAAAAPAVADWWSFCQGDGSKFCCMRNGCHFVCNCTL